MKFKVKILCALCAFALIRSHAATLVVTPLTDAFGNPIVNRQIELTPISPQGMPAGDILTTNTDSNGNLFVSNVFAGDLQFQIMAPPSTTTYWLKIPNTNGIVYATNCLEVNPINVFPPGQNAWAQTTSDGRYLFRIQPSTSNYVATAQDTNGDYLWEPLGTVTGAVTNAVGTNVPGLVSLVNSTIIVGTNPPNSGGGLTNLISTNGPTILTGGGQLLLLATNYDLFGAAATVLSTIQGQLGTIAANPTNWYAAVPAVTTTSNFLGFSGKSNVVVDSGYNFGTFDTNGSGAYWAFIGSNNLRGLLGTAAFQGTGAFDAAGTAASLVITGSNNIESGLGTIAPNSSNLYAAVPPSTTSSNFVGYGPRSNIVIDTGYNFGTFDTNGAGAYWANQGSNHLYGLLGTAAFQGTGAFDAAGTAASLVTTGSNNIESALGTIAPLRSNLFAAVPATASTSNFMGFGGNTNLAIDTGYNFGTFDTNKAAIYWAGIVSNALETAFNLVLSFPGTNYFAAVPASAVSGDFASFNGHTNVLADSGFSSSSFDAAGAAATLVITGSNNLRGQLGTAAFQNATAFDASGTAASLVITGSNNIEAGLGTIASQPTNRFAAVPASATGGNIVTWNGGTNALSDSGYSPTTLPKIGTNGGTGWAITIESNSIGGTALTINGNQIINGNVTSSGSINTGNGVAGSLNIYDLGIGGNQTISANNGFDFNGATLKDGSVGTTLTAPNGGVVAGLNDITSATNGHFDPIGSATAATNAVGLSSGLSAYVTTNRFDTNGAGLAYANVVGANNTNNTASAVNTLGTGLTNLINTGSNQDFVLGSNSAAYWTLGTQVLTNGATNVFHFKSYSGSPSLANVGPWIWYSSQACYSNWATTFICTNVGTGGSPTWIWQTYTGTPITVLTNTFPIGGTIIISGSGTTEWGFTQNGDATRFTGFVELPNTPTIIQSNLSGRFTNSSFWGTNTAMGIHLTNDASGNTVLDFYGLSSSVGQFPMIMLSSNAGDGAYGFIGENGNHAGAGHNAPANSELPIVSSGTIALVTGNGTGPSHLQIFGSGVNRGNVYTQYDTTGSGANNSYPSSIWTAHTGWLGPLGLDLHDPGWRAHMVQTNGGQIKWAMEFIPQIGAISDNWTDSTVTNLHHLYYGTNNVGNLFWESVWTGGVLGSASNYFDINTNGINISGNLTDGNPTVDSWSVANSFQTANGNFQLTGNSLNLFPANASGILIVGDGSGASASHNYFASGPAFSGSLFTEGSISMGTNGNAPSGNELYVVGRIAATSQLTMVTNTSIPAAIIGFDFLATSNGDLYWVTAAKTNLVSAGH